MVTWAEASQLNKDRASAKAEILRLAKLFWREHQKDQNKVAADEQFIKSLKAGQIGNDICRQLRTQDISVPSLYRWRARYEETGLEGLLDDYRGGKCKLSDKAQAFTKKIILGDATLRLRYRDIYKKVCFLLKDHPEERTPSYYQIKSLVKAFRSENRHGLVLKHEGVNGLRDRNMTLALGREDGSTIEPLQRVEIDTTVADLMDKGEKNDCTIVTGDGKRSRLILLVDVYSRAMRARLIPEESAQAATVFVSDVMKEWGCFKELWSDNGKIFKSKRFHGFLESAGTRHCLCRPYDPQQKGIVERGIRTVSEGLLRLLTGYTGPDVPNRPKEIKVKYTRPDANKLLTCWLIKTYGWKPHSATGEPPEARMMKPGFEAKKVDPQLLDEWSALWEKRKVCHGCVRYKRGKYYHRDLPPVSSTVWLRIRDDDAGTVSVYDDKRRFRCDAEDRTLHNRTQREVRIERQEKNKFESMKLKAHADALKNVDASRATPENMIEADEKRAPIPFRTKARPVTPSKSDDPVETVEYEGSGLFMNEAEKYRALSIRKRAGETLSFVDRRFMKEFEDDDHFSLIAQNIQRQLDEEAINEG